jgi:hypothetical protein
MLIGVLGAECAGFDSLLLLLAEDTDAAAVEAAAAVF